MTATLPATMLAQTVVIFDTSPDNVPYLYVFVSVPDFTLSYIGATFFQPSKVLVTSIRDARMHRSFRKSNDATGIKYRTYISITNHGLKPA